MWLRYVDDTFVLIHEYDVESFTAHINSIDNNIKFTMEPEEQGKLPFLDLCVHVLDDGSTKITVYRKPTHTDQYLNFSSNHPIQHKRSVVRTLLHRAHNYVSEEHDRQREIHHVTRALKANGYEDWAISNPKPRKPRDAGAIDQGPKPTVGIPYVRNVSEELARAYHRHNVNTFMKPINTITSQLVKPKDRTPQERQSCVVYKINCDQDPSHFYIGETKWTLATRFAEHVKPDNASGVSEHLQSTGHTVSLDKANILVKEEKWYPRKVKEAVQIKIQRPPLNRDQGLQLPPIYDNILIPERRLAAKRSKIGHPPRDQGP